MMRVLLIYPPLTKYERYSSDIGNAGGKQVPLGIYYLASYLEKFGHTVSLIDAEAMELSIARITGHARRFRPDAVGISATTVAFHKAAEVAAAIKRHFPEVPVILGGPHVTAAAEDAMKHSQFDIGVIGEGERSLLETIEALSGRTDLSDVHGIVFRRDGELRRTPPRDHIPDLDRLPFPAFEKIPDFSLYNPPPCNYKKVPVMNLITSRGCPNHCTFCDRSVFGRKLRQRSAENIAEEISLLYRRYGVREIAFVDDTFTLRPERIFRLFEILDRRGISFPWTCMSRISTVDYETLKFMRDKGCWHISFGIESGNEEILRRIRKKVSLDAARMVIGWCRQLGILTKGFFILGHPGETVETMDQTIRVSLDLPLDDVVVTLNTPLPGTEQYRDARQKGLLAAPDWAKYNMWNPVYVPEGLAPGDLLEKHRQFYRKFYFRPRILVRYGLSFLSVSGLKRFTALLRSLPFIFKKRTERTETDP